MPIPSVTEITEDRLVIGIEGTSLKEQLPELRGGSTVPFYFQIVDYEPTLGGLILRQKIEGDDELGVDLIFSEEYNGCNKPRTDCPDPESEDDGASSLLASFTAAALAGASLLAF